MKKRNETKDIRIFAGGMGVISVIFASVSIWKGGGAYPYILAVGLSFALVGLTSPRIIRPVYLKWMLFAGVIGRFNAKLLLTLTFLFIVTPIGLLMRLMGKDLLEEKWEPDAETYWKKREPERDVSRYTQQF